MHSNTSFNLRGLIDSSANRVLDLHSDFVNPQYAKVLRTIGFDVNYARAEGAYLYDDKGQQYIDCLGGYAVFPLGRNSPEIQDAIKQAMDLQLPNLPGIGPFKLAGLLAQRLLELAPGNFGKVFFATGGAEAVDAAIKMARIYTARQGLIYCHRGYHGLTMGALSVTGNAEFREGFGDLLASTVEIPFNDLSALERELSTGRHAAFIVEPIQGKGVNMPSENYLREASMLCKKHGTVPIADEIQVGIGRTGKWFASQHFGCGRPEDGGSWQPDIFVVAKALSGGYVPVSAVIARDEIHRAVFSSMGNCSKMQNTFSMNDLSMTVGLATLHYMRERQTCEHVTRVGNYLVAGLRDRLRQFEMFKEVRGHGLMIAVEFQRPQSLGLRLGWDMVHKLDESLFCQAILMPMLTDHRVLAQVAGHRLDVIKLIPPLTLSEADCDKIIRAFEATVAACHSLAGPMWAVGKKLAAAKMRTANV
ncbi:MAG: aspartate aminotransferase family protein [Phycisphaerales bacterium]|nr:aspartate aminotransferase family protein [Phycisphaerales bacterium]